MLRYLFICFEFFIYILQTTYIIFMIKVYHYKNDRCVIVLRAKINIFFQSWFIFLSLSHSFSLPLPLISLSFPLFLRFLSLSSYFISFFSLSLSLTLSLSIYISLSSIPSYCVSMDVFVDPNPWL